MKRLFFILVFINLYLTTYNQIIKGTILDKETKSPITYATIYFEGTSVASFTNGKGNFVLDIKNINSMPLTISALGYYSMTLDNFSPEKVVLVYLSPKIFKLNEISVTVRGNPKIRKQNLEIFRREFLGRTENAKECQILNEDDIRFIISANKDTLKAFSIKPIIVNNKGLGYNITYFMDNFEYIKSESVNHLVGKALFNKDTTSLLDENIELRRNYAYFGSRMNFFRSLWLKELKLAGFTVKNKTRTFTDNELVRYQVNLDTNRVKKYIYYSNTLPVILTITFEPVKAESGMELSQNNIYFDKDGYYKGRGIIWHGEMAKEGIADLLPYDFQPTYKLKDKVDP